MNFIASLGEAVDNSTLSRKKNLRPYDLVDGKRVVHFTEERAMLVETCQWTISKFRRIQPLIERICLDFQRTIPLEGSVQIGV